MAEEYGPEGNKERFSATLFVVMCNRLVTCGVAGLMLLITGQSLTPQAPMWNFLAVSGTLRRSVRSAPVSVVAAWWHHKCWVTLRAMRARHRCSCVHPGTIFSLYWKHQPRKD
jgi:hypothetical protein